MRTLSLRSLIPVSLLLSLCFVSSAFSQEARQEEPAKIIRKSAGVFQSSAIKCAKPEYPPAAKAALISGSVVVEVTVDEGGKVISARALSGHPLFKNAAVTAAECWIFAPTMLSGVPVKVIGTITFKFDPNDDDMDDEEKSVEELQRAIAANPRSAELYRRLGNAYHYEDREQEAIRAYEKAVELKPDYVEAYKELGNMYERTDQYDKAIKAYEKAIQLKPDDAEVYEDLADTYRSLKREDMAIDTLKRRVAANPDSAYAHYKLGMAYDDDEMSVKELEKAIQLKPDYEEVYSLLAHTYIHLKQYDKALDTLKRQLVHGPQNGGAHMDMARVYFKLNRLDESFESTKKALNLSPKFLGFYRPYDVHAMMGMILFDKGRYSEALSSFKEALALVKDTSRDAGGQINLCRGMTYVIAGDRESAMKEYLILKGNSWETERAEQLLKRINSRR